MPSPFDDEMTQALDVMCKADWIAGYIRREQEAVISWTDNGKEKIALLWSMIRELGVQNLIQPPNENLWWKVLRVAAMDGSAREEVQAFASLYDPRLADVFMYFGGRCYRDVIGPAPAVLIAFEIRLWLERPDLVTGDAKETVAKLIEVYDAGLSISRQQFLDEYLPLIEAWIRGGRLSI